ncbi:hypothetical protein C9374_004360 [Naegleria lovaniensis]|uniref:Uncharacterized protein n=1 Tax=Naegleria lovaniensis TaxID=51637 RepID=A0AA88KJ90_NAELO|nr:uncharacterized protein C9374_004360 [Naegleria lovaniensis]KAG2383689.1 hypothetical protein C9374_004360 [Naegleria lovaniensis]
MLSASSFHEQTLSVHHEHQEEGDALLRRVVASNFVGNGTPPPSPSNTKEARKKNMNRKFNFNLEETSSPYQNKKESLLPSERLDKLRALSISMEKPLIQEVERVIAPKSSEHSAYMKREFITGTASQAIQNQHRTLWASSFLSNPHNRPKSKSRPSDYVVSFDLGESKGVVSSNHVLDPSERSFEHNKDKRKELAEKLECKSKGQHFKPFFKFIKSQHSTRNQERKTTIYTEEPLKNATVIGGGINDLLSKSVEEEIQENECTNVQELMTSGFYLYSGVLADMNQLDHMICREFLQNENRLPKESLHLNVLLSIDFQCKKSYFSVVSHESIMIKGRVERISRFPTKVDDLLQSIEHAFEKVNTHKSFFSMKRQEFPPSQYISCDMDIEQSILNFGSVHGQTAVCEFEQQKNIERWPFQPEVPKVKAVLICNDNLNNQYVSRGVWQLLHLYTNQTVSEAKSNQDEQTENQNFEEPNELNCSSGCVNESISKEQEMYISPEISSHQDAESVDPIVQNHSVNETSPFNIQTPLVLVPFDIECFSENTGQQGEDGLFTNILSTTEVEKQLETPILSPLLHSQPEEESSVKDQIISKIKEEQENKPEVFTRTTGDSFEYFKDTFEKEDKEELPDNLLQKEANDMKDQMLE